MMLHKIRIFLSDFSLAHITICGLKKNTRGVVSVSHKTLSHHRVRLWVIRQCISGCSPPVGPTILVIDNHRFNYRDRTGGVKNCALPSIINFNSLSCCIMWSIHFFRLLTILFHNSLLSDILSCTSLLVTLSIQLIFNILYHHILKISFATWESNWWPRAPKCTFWHSTPFLDKRFLM